MKTVVALTYVFCKRNVRWILCFCAAALFYAAPQDTAQAGVLSDFWRLEWNYSPAKTRKVLAKSCPKVWIETSGHGGRTVFAARGESPLYFIACKFVRNKLALLHEITIAHGKEDNERVLKRQAKDFTRTLVQKYGFKLDQEKSSPHPLYFLSSANLRISIQVVAGSQFATPLPFKNAWCAILTLSRDSVKTSNKNFDITDEEVNRTLDGAHKFLEEIKQ